LIAASTLAAAVSAGGRWEGSNAIRCKNAAKADDYHSDDDDELG
jgi:hypothetical protein